MLFDSILLTVELVSDLESILSNPDLTLLYQLLLPDFFVTLWIIACHAPLCMGFSWQEYWGRLPFPVSGDHLDTGIKLTTPESLELAGGVFTTDSPEKTYL